VLRAYTKDSSNTAQEKVVKKPHISAAVAAVLFARDVLSEDALDQETCRVEDAGLEEKWKEPGHGYQSVHEYIDWFSDGEDSRYETN
jgi:hypothetical protein